MGEQTTAVPITSANLDAAASTLSRAFADDPIFVWMTRGRSVHHPRLARSLRQLMESELRKPDPVLFMTVDGGAAAIWQGIDAWKASVSESIRSIPSWVPMLDRCDAEGVPAYLENSKPRNEALYARLGFVATGPIPLPKGAPPFTAMWREPRSS